MKLHRILHFSLAAMLTIATFGMTAHAEDLQIVPKSLPQNLNLSNAQVLKIQALFFSQSEEVRSLYLNVQSAQESLRTAVVKGAPILMAAAVLSLDAAEKALQNTQAANQRDLLSLLNESQKELVKDYLTPSPTASTSN
jgi:hypothetical protein